MHRVYGVKKFRVNIELSSGRSVEIIDSSPHGNNALERGVEHAWMFFTSAVRKEARGRVYIQSIRVTELAE